MGSFVIAVLLLVPMLAKAANKDTDEARVKASGDVLKELLNGPNGIFLSLLNKAECVIVLPSEKKVGFLVAGSYGRGVMSCRCGQNFDGAWSAPIMMQSSGGIPDSGANEKIGDAQAPSSAETLLSNVTREIAREGFSGKVLNPATANPYY